MFLGARIVVVLYHRVSLPTKDLFNTPEMIEKGADWVTTTKVKKIILLGAIRQKMSESVTRHQIVRKMNTNHVIKYICLQMVCITEANNMVTTTLRMSRNASVA